MDLDPAAQDDQRGDQFIWNFPNCGNPQKVQRYPLEWAASLRSMAAMDAELFVPAHGLPIAGPDRIRTCLETVAATLEVLVADVVDAMNAGAVLDDILHSVSVPAATLGAAVPAAAVRRAGVRDPQHLAPVRRVVGRKPGAFEAGLRCRDRRRGRRARRRRRPR